MLFYLRFPSLRLLCVVLLCFVCLRVFIRLQQPLQRPWLHFFFLFLFFILHFFLAKSFFLVVVCSDFLFISQLAGCPWPVCRLSLFDGPHRLFGHGLSQ